jgi:hypothetical protein
MPCLETELVREHQWQLRGYVLDRGAFNEMRMRLPRAVRRDVEAAPEGHVGLVAQAVVGADGDTPVAVLYDNAPAPMAEQRLHELRRRLAELLR